MHDLRLIRDDPAAFDAALARRGLAPLAATLLDSDDLRRASIQQAQEALTQRNAASKLIGAAMARGDGKTAERIKAEVAALKERIALDEAEADRNSELFHQAMALIPNLPAPDVPHGADESGNVEVKRWGDPSAPDFARDHADFGPALGLDFEAGAALSGARFTVLRGGMARLHRALGQFMLDRQTGTGGYTEIAPPLLVRDEALFGTGQLPKFADDLFRTTGDHWLIPTAEVSLTNLVANRILDTATLPLRYAALTQCFRSEAGAAGRDTRGLIRQHQFEKVELVSIVAPDRSDAELERMTGCAEAVLEALGLAYRRMLLCAGDMGFSARRTYDLEVWLPGQRRYREISSCSTCGDFQARRMNARARRLGEKATHFAHTLNGSGLAVGRTLVAVLETYQEADGSVTIPDILHPYMAGVTRLSPEG